MLLNRDKFGRGSSWQYRGPRLQLQLQLQLQYDNPLSDVLAYMSSVLSRLWNTKLHPCSCLVFLLLAPLLKQTPLRPPQLAMFLSLCLSESLPVAFLLYPIQYWLSPSLSDADVPILCRNFDSDRVDLLIMFLNCSSCATDRACRWRCCSARACRFRRTF